MRLCIATRTAFVSGGETMLLRLAKELANLEHTVCVVCPAGSKAYEFFADNKLTVEGVDLHLTDWRHPLRFFGSVRALRKIMRTHRVEVAHANDLSTIQPLGCACRKEGIPVVVHVRQTVKPGGPEWYFKYGADHVIAVSEYIKRHLVETSPAVFEGRTSVSLDGITVGPPADADAKRLARQTLEIPEDRFVFLYANQFNEVKGLPDLIQAVALLPEALRSRLLLCAVGDDVQTGGVYRENMMQLARDKGVAEWIRFPGYRRDVPTWIAACDWCVSPSLVEPLGTTVIESLSSGRPVIGTRVGGIPEMVLENQTGLLVDGGQPEQLSAAMAKALAQPELAVTLGRGAHEFARQQFTIERHAQEMLAIYRLAIASRAKGGR
ncbi:MAG: glycosyltransferase family 4 protein [Phycisphaerae bacterium]|nr:glycosyltransferase family 4 protein [Phycisphaerae bacterium]